ncbi:hypothetical protein HMPREF3291_05205 [Bacillus sp. HMSC76G11]|nr:hypothetical protein HMPREF3291_05205 [Bacillus sp. HMSC76G11]
MTIGFHPYSKKAQIGKKMKPSMKVRKTFSAEVKKAAAEKWDYLCANCQSARPDDPHHIRRKSDDGKGVLTNCLPVCRPCHNEIERNAELRQKWKEWAKKEYGQMYWADQWDMEARNAKVSDRRMQQDQN